MTQAIEQFKTQLGALTPRERAELAYFLLESLDDNQEGIEEAWRMEVARRVDEIRSGQAVGIPAEELFAELRELYP